MHRIHKIPDCDHILACWVKGWALARDVPAPVRYTGGFRTDVGWPEQKTRYVFATVNDDYRRLAQTITEPYVFLKACAPAEDVREILPARWSIQPVGYMMTCVQPMNFSGLTIPGNYRLHIETKDAVTTVRVWDRDEIAAIGHMVFIDDYAIYDRIETMPGHRRIGLASAVVQALQKAGLEKGISKGVLVATADGRPLYEKLGWDLFSFYTTAVILPG